MIDRYSTKIAEIWSENNKFLTWLRVELAVLQAKAEMGLIPKEAYQRIEIQAHFFPERFYRIDTYLEKVLTEAAEGNTISRNLASLIYSKIHDLLQQGRILEIEKEVEHDLIAFIETVRENLDDDLKALLHQNMTSYDTEEPAFALRIIDSMNLIIQAITDLLDLLLEKAKQHKELVRIERTHGQHAEPNTLGLVFLYWYDSLERQMPFLNFVLEQIRESKISGAVGTYTGNLTPKLEQKALKILGLRRARISMQIILRDRHAHVINALAVIAGVLENMALNLRLLGQTEICEIQEPFGKKQKGSSRMPHKKNTIMSENLCGLARVVRHNAGMALENIPTWGGRSIEQSSVERVIFPDCFNLLHFMLKRMKKVIEGLVVNEENIQRNLEFTKYVIFSPEVNDFLIKQRFSPEMAYWISQEDAFEAINTGRSFFTILVNDDRLSGVPKGELMKLANIESKLVHVDEIYQRFGLTVRRC